MAIAYRMKLYMDKASWIRKMFEEKVKLDKSGRKLFDFTLGNPDLPPPESFYKALFETLKDKLPKMHGYMENSGFSETREALASYLSKIYKKELRKEHIILTCGAAGGINVVLKSILNPEDEVIIIVPYFPEYIFYVENHFGVVSFVESNDDFSLNIRAIGRSISRRTKAIILNSPNNPSGAIYKESELKALADLLRRWEKESGNLVYTIFDEPYRRITFGGKTVPSPFLFLKNSICVGSFSKELSIAGERIGYVALNPDMENVSELFSAISVANRILGFVNATSLLQRALTRIIGDCVDVSIYERRMNIAYDMLSSIGYELKKPDGTFYLFPKSPIEDSMKFMDILKEEGVLVVPGDGFGKPGYFRMALCVDEKVIKESKEGFEKAFYKAKNLENINF